MKEKAYYESIDKKNEIHTVEYKLLLSNEDIKESINAIVKVSISKSLLGDIYSMDIIHNDGIAFDHSKIIVTGLLKSGLI